MVPSSLKQSWHRESSIIQLATLAFLTWGHCPAVRAEASAGAHLFDHVVVIFFAGTLPLISWGTTLKKSMSMKGAAAEA